MALIASIRARRRSSPPRLAALAGSASLIAASPNDAPVAFLGFRDAVALDAMLDNFISYDGLFRRRYRATLFGKD
ncbi:MAG: hypothetical protein ACREPW_06350, partial [Candidatus Binataceae bacterium]